MGRERLLALCLALALDLLLGDLPNRWHPVAWMGACIRALECRCPVCGRAAQFLYGMGLMLLGGALFALPWLAIAFFWPAEFELHWGWRALLTALALKPTFALRRLLEAGREIRLALARADLDEARRLVGWHLVSRDTRALSAGQVASAVVESLAENLTDSLVAPLFYFILLGLPGVWFYRFVNTADAMIGYHTPRYEYLGKFAARLDDLLNFLPARLAALCLVLGAGLCGLDACAAGRVMLNQHGRTSSPNAGWTMAAAAGALGVRLEKSGCYVLNEREDWPEVEDIRLVQVLLGWAAAVSLIALGGLHVILFR
ncbi:MAG: adenosylcobinamide-phosphate synthase [Chloroflexota bacterium]|nr:adenosylcobinamide-phosphate synthase [Chloroflexota bacterium]